MAASGGPETNRRPFPAASLAVAGTAGVVVADASSKAGVRLLRVRTALRRDRRSFKVDWVASDKTAEVRNF